MKEKYEKKIGKPMIALFALKLFFYLSTAGLVTLHPGIAVSFDRLGLILWFVVIPVSSLIAFLPSPGGRLRNKCILAALFIIGVSIPDIRFGPDLMFLYGTGVMIFIMNLLLFYYPRWGKFAVLEPFFLAWVCLRLLAFSRSGEQAAGEYFALTQFILMWSIIVFLFQSAIIYLCLHPKSISGVRREGAIGFLTGAAALILVFFILPPDFVQNAIITNLRSDRIDREIDEGSEYGMPQDADGREEGRGTLPRNRNNNTGGRLRGIDEGNWPDPNRQGSRSGRNGDGDGGQQEQYAVMIVATQHEPVYMGGEFRGMLDPVEGFMPSPEENLNALSLQRLFATWYNNNRVFNRGRSEVEVISFSTLTQRYFPYRPTAVEPTILSGGAGPFRFTHRITSNMHIRDPLELVRIHSRGFRDIEMTNLAHYLEINLTPEDRERFSAYLMDVLTYWNENRSTYIQRHPYLRHLYEGSIWRINNEYMERIIALVFNYRNYQYTLQPGNHATIADIDDFLFNTKEGDCVEFSNSLALLGRLAGIPSRVVTGYLAADSLQTDAHWRGLAVLRNRIPALQEFPLRDLYLVTNLHSHSWVQFYLPDYGWLDFEATAFAIPPVGAGDFNTWDVIIPIINEDQLFSHVRLFPWRAVLRSIGIFVFAGLIALYSLRYGREALLLAGAKRGGREGARSLYLLLLARLAAEGKPIKPASKTASEYGSLFPGTKSFTGFADIYGQLRWRNFSGREEVEQSFSRLKEEYQNILNAERQKGVAGFFRRVFSLRGLGYL